MLTTIHRGGTLSPIKTAAMFLLGIFVGGELTSLTYRSLVVWQAEEIRALNIDKDELSRIIELHKVDMIMVQEEERILRHAIGDLGLGGHLKEMEDKLTIGSRR